MFLAPWSRSRLKKKPGAGAGAALEKNQDPEPEPLEKKSQEPEPEKKFAGSPALICKGSSLFCQFSFCTLYNTGVC